MKKIIIGIVLISFILSGIIYYDLLERTKCKQKICPIDCGFSPTDGEKLKKCEKETTYIIKYFRFFN